MCADAKDMQLHRLRLLLEDAYNIYQIFSDMADAGHAGASRPRTYVIFARKDGKVLFDPITLYGIISDTISKVMATTPKDYLNASRREVDMEAAEVCRIRGIQHRPGAVDFSYILNEREKNAIRELSVEYRRRFNKKPEDDADLCFFLGDDPGFSRTWSAVSKKVPTFRRNSSAGKTWYPRARRWLTPAEKLLAFELVDWDLNECSVCQFMCGFSSMLSDWGCPRSPCPYAGTLLPPWVWPQSQSWTQSAPPHSVETWWRSVVLASCKW